jgi:2,4-dienoyl-CoA reductase-like NADH-dependent reductase (Old Yellow Enzyme family)
MSEYPDRALSDYVQLSRTRLPNRIIRAATYEGMADTLGMPQQSLTHLYTELLDGGSGTLITGALYVQQEGRLPWPHQCGADTPEALSHWEPILNQLHRHKPEAILVAQLCHGGALSYLNHTHPIAPSRCQTIHGNATEATPEQIDQIIQAFARAARLAIETGFDAIQIHAADGYLIHQFLSHETNHRQDAWGEPTAFLMAIIERVRHIAGPDLPIWVKLPWMDDDPHGIRLEQTRATVTKLEHAGVELCEISYGTMKRPSSIVRGDIAPRDWANAHPHLAAMPAPKRAIWTLSAAGRNHRSRDFTPAYNARTATQLTALCKQMTLIPSGGIYSLDDASFCINDLGLAAVALSRALIHNPRLPREWMDGNVPERRCKHCNRCLIAAHSHSPLTCTGTQP